MMLPVAWSSVHKVADNGWITRIVCLPVEPLVVDAANVVEVLLAGAEENVRRTGREHFG